MDAPNQVKTVDKALSKFDGIELNLNYKTLLSSVL